jgi:hypothetical protein
LDRLEYKEFLVKHIRENAQTGSPISELHQVVPSVSSGNLKRLLIELRGEGRITLQGKRRWARWYPQVPVVAEQNSKPSGSNED